MSRTIILSAVVSAAVSAVVVLLALRLFAPAPESRQPASPPGFTVPGRDFGWDMQREQQQRDQRNDEAMRRFYDQQERDRVQREREVMERERLERERRQREQTARLRHCQRSSFYC